MQSFTITTPVGKVLPMMTYKVRFQPKAIEVYLCQA